MPRSYPDPWPTTDEAVRTWKINNGYDFLLERLELPEKLFSENPYSLDGIALTMIAFGTLAEFYGNYEALASGGTKSYGDDILRFRTILLRFCPSFENRLSIPELARRLKSATDGKMLTAAAHLDAILRKYPIQQFPQARQTNEDPIAAEFAKWAKESNFSPPNMLFNLDYAGLLFDYYRNSVVHQLSVARGREAIALPDGLFEKPDSVFYSNQRESTARGDYDNMRIGFRPLSILDWARESIENARSWAHQTDTDIFPA